MNAPIFIWMILELLVAAPGVYLLGRLSRGIQKSTTPLLTCLSLVVAGGLYALSVRDFLSIGTITFTLGTIAMRVDGLSLLLAAVSLTLALLVAIYSHTYLLDEDGIEKYYGLLLILIASIIGLSCAGDLFNLWIWFEVMALSSYLLVAFYHEQATALEAGVKYLIQSAVGSILVLIGIALVLMQTGTLDLLRIQNLATSTPILVAAGALLLIGFGVKAAFVPLHTWLPDAHSQAPSGISALLSGIVIEAALIALLRAITPLLAVSHWWGTLLLVLGSLNMLIGNLLALQQTQLKRLLAFSSVSQVGYMLLGFGIALSSDQTTGAQGAVFHLITHSLMKGLAFLAVGALLYALHLTQDSHAPLTLVELAGAARRYPLVAFTLSLSVLSLAGLPPFAGFFSKWQIFVAGFNTHTLIIEVLVIFAAFNSVLSLGYYAPLVNILYRQQPSIAVLNGAPLNLTLTAPLVLLAGLVVLVGLWPTALTWLTEPAGAAILSVFGH
jgi:proton-translocating NADH-quinone oxidoreductase chain N